MGKRIALIIVSIILGIWAVLPDPLPIFIDDVIATLGSVIALLNAIKGFI